jgi:hypothetical protein
MFFQGNGYNVLLCFYTVLVVLLLNRELWMNHAAHVISTIYITGKDR